MPHHRRHLFIAVGTALLLVFPARADLYVAQAGQTPDHVGGYTTWSGAASNIQNAVNAASPNATVWVGPGHYTCPTNGEVYNGITNVVYIDKPLTLRSSNGVPASVVIDGLGTNRGINIFYNADTSDRFILNGLTVSNSCDHGILFYASGNDMLWTGVVQNCVITHTKSGAGIYNTHYSNPRTLLISDTVSRNNADRGIQNYSTINTPISSITDCVIENNSGGGLSFHRGIHTIRRCIVRDNSSPASSGGFSMGIGDYYLYNCLVYGNSANGIGGAIYKWNATGPLEIHNCTIVSNLSTSAGSGGIRSSAVNPIYNSIIRYNHVGANISDWYNGGTTTFTNSCSTGTMGGTGNISDDPEFVDLGGFDFHIPKTSPCANSGTNLTWMAGAIDLDGYPRIDSGPHKVDMGCYEAVYYGTVVTVQ